MTRRCEIRIAGSGGQGIVTAGRILAEAAILSGHCATHSQAYGPQSRGGASRSDVVISDREIGFPLVESVGVLVALTGQAHDRYRGDVGDGARIILDDRAAASCRGNDGGHALLALVDTARAISGGQLMTGIVALGVVQGFEDIVDADALTEAVSAGVPPRYRDANLEALRAGIALAGSGIALAGSGAP